MDIDNRTPFEVNALPHIDQQGQRARLLVVKGVWSLHNNQLSTRVVPALQIQTSPHLVRMGKLLLHPQQKRVLQAMDCLERSIEWMPADNAPHKLGFEMIICGYGHQSTAQAKFECSVRWGDQDVSLQAMGPRLWQSTLVQGAGAVEGSLLEEVQHVPLHPAFTWGGIAPQIVQENPAGMGQPHHEMKALGNCAPMPWLQDKRLGRATALLPPKALAFGPWDSSAAQRQRHAGTYDQAWQRERAPLPPLDQKAAFFNQASPLLQWTRPPPAGQDMTLLGMSRYGTRRLHWPGVQVQVTHAQTARQLQPDTCLVSTEDDAFALLWRCILPAQGHVQLTAS
jgi:hypothetical protein